MSVRNRKCGTCRFYQEAQLASSGWCHHPQRKTTSDIMIMVRKNELACRDEWAHDLWEAKSAQPETAAAAPGQFGDRKERPATEAEIAAILAANSSAINQQETQSDAGEGASDIVLSELGAGPEPNTYVERVEPPREWAQASSRSVEPADSSTKKPDHATTARGAIIRAREAYRERSRQVAARSQEITRLAASAPQAPLASAAESDLAEHVPLTPTAGEASSSVQDQAPEVAAVSPESAEPETDDIVLSSGDVDAAYGSSASASGSRAFDDSLGLEADRPDWMDDLDEAANSHRAASRDTHQQAQREAVTAHHQHFEDPFDAPIAAERDRPASTPSRGARADLYDNQGSRASARADRAATSEPGDSASRPPSADRPPYWSASQQKGDRYRETEEAPLEADLASEQDVAYDNIENDIVDDLAATADQIELEAARDWDFDREPGDEYAADDVVAQDDHQRDAVIPLRPALSAHLPRICRTCRDFRPAETGERGWCANQWAFSHRRVVAADEQTPCESVLGDWWLPADEVWSDAADVSSHGQPTPLLDAWLPEYQENQPSRRRS